MEIAPRTVVASQVGEAVEDVGEGVAKARLNSFILTFKRGRKIHAAPTA
jgi:hypothetical protein